MYSGTDGDGHDEREAGDEGDECGDDGNNEHEGGVGVEFGYDEYGGADGGNDEIEGGGGDSDDDDREGSSEDSDDGSDDDYVDGNDERGMLLLVSLYGEQRGGTIQTW